MQVEKYNPEWELLFVEIKSKLEEAIGFVNPVVEHIGSTSVKGLSAKPIIDILVGLRSEGDLVLAAQPLMDKGYVYYEKYNELMPYRRFFVKHSVTPVSLTIPICIGRGDEILDASVEHSYRLAHIHAMPYNTEH